MEFAHLVLAKLKIQSALREPTLHFLLIGVVIFVAYGVFAPHGLDRGTRS